MSGDTSTGAADEERRLREEFPDWRIAYVSGEWLATRGPLVREDLPAGTLRAGTSDELYRLLDARRR